MKNDITPELIKSMSYPDFVGLLNQWNTPPGAYTSLMKLATFSNINKKSVILEVGCSTGFSSREIANIYKCKGEAFDLSRKSIEMAIYNKNSYSKNIKIDYSVADGYTFKTKNKFTHIMVGGNLKFFPDSSKMLSRCIDMLVDGGYILATPYYGIKTIPKKLAKRMHDVIGIKLDKSFDDSYKEIMKLYNKFEIIYEEKNDLTLETKEEINSYCNSVVDRACEINKIKDTEIKRAIFSRLLEIRQVINQSRKYQKYCVLVLRYRKKIYPNRYVALF